MNKSIKKPLIIQFTSPEHAPVIKRQSKSIFVPANTPWNQFENEILPLVADKAYDSVLVHATNDMDRDAKNAISNMTIKLNALCGRATKVAKPVLTYESPDQPFYLANPTIDDRKKAPTHAPSDAEVMEKYNSFKAEESDTANPAWDEHQAKVWARMKDMMPLSRKSDQWNRNHAAQLKDPKRGFQDKDLGKFWTFKSGQNLSPTIMGDNMVGMPSVEARAYEGFTMSTNQPDGTVKTKDLTVLSLTTYGTSGIAIPMANADGHVVKHQIAADLTAYSTALHFRAEDGRTVAKGEVFDKKTKEYSFKFADGTPTHLKAKDVTPDETITMQDAHGIFNIKPKREIIDVLKERGYDIPPIIASVKAEQNGKYMWQSPGTMTGSDEVQKTVTPSNPGFIIARQPKNGEKQYNVLIAEGALKGHIVAKYVDVKDKDGICFGDHIAGDKGIIVTQVPGVAEAFVKGALVIYDKYDVKGTYIAMDADGKENRNVAKGIHTAYDCISKKCATTVMSWDPAQKGLDDALLAVAQGKITISDMKITTGHPDKLFPLEGTQNMTPYRLDGTVKARPDWMEEYTEDKKDRDAKLAEAQKATAERQEQKDDTVTITEAKPETKWVETPADISNIQNTTVTKAAEAADAMAGNMPAPKAEPRLQPTPDADEKIKEEPVNAAEEDNRAKKWDAANPAMTPLSVPEGYAAEYTYKQPIMRDRNEPLNIPSDASFEGHKLGDWGVVSIVTRHEMAEAEIDVRQTELEDNGLECVGSLRLVSQTFTLDKGLELSNDDLPSLDEGNGIKQ